MCGIFGWVSFNKSGEIGSEKVFLRLMKLSVRRGKDASGMWMWDGKSEQSLVLPENGKKLINTDKFKSKILRNLNKGLVVLGHTRLATNGLVTLTKNNQPMIREDLVLAHNGIIVNSGELAHKFEIVNEESDTLVLAKILVELKKQKNDLISSVKLLSGLVCGTMNLALIKKNNKNCELVLASNNGSLFLGWTDQGVFFASEKIFLKKISKIINGEMLVDQIRSNTGWRFVVGTKKYEEFFLADSKVMAQSIVKEEVVSKRLKEHKIDFEKISKIKRCIQCILPATTPFISFDKNGRCNYCCDHKKIKTKGSRKLMKIVEKHRSKNGKVDCIIAFSGGRDSSYGLHYLVKEMGMHPVAVTFDWGMLSDVGRRNQARVLAALGIEHIIIAANIEKARKDIKNNLLAWLKKPDLGMVPLLMQGDKMTEYYVDQVKKELGVELVFFCRGNELEREEFKAGYCGVKNADPGGVIHDYAWIDKFRLLFYYSRQFLLNRSYLNSSLWSSFLGYLITYIVPHDYIYIWHYVPWEEKKIISILKNTYNWEGDLESGATWRVDDGSPGFYNYIYCQIQGFTENDSFRSRQIREGMITRNMALELVYKENKPRYQSLNWYFKSIGVEGDSVLKMIDAIPKKY